MRLVTSAPTRNQRRKITQVKFPVHRLRGVLKFDEMFAEEFLQVIFVAAEIAEFGGVLQRKFQRLQRVVKAHEPEPAGEVPRGTQHGERVRRRAEADIPDHKFAGVMLQPFAQPELVDIQRLRLRNRADDRMKRLVIRKRAHGTNAVVEADELVAGV